MILNCKHCPAEFKSLDLRNDVALKECCDALINHVALTHSAWLRTGQENVQRGVMAMIWLSTMELHGAIPNTETFIHEEVEKYRVALMKIIGVGVAEEEKKVMA